MPIGKPKLVEVPPLLETLLTGAIDTISGEASAKSGAGNGKVQAQPTLLFDTQEKRKTASATLEIIRHYEKLKGIEELKKPEIQAQIVREVEAAIAPAQQNLEGIIEKPDIQSVVAAVTQAVVEQTIEIPEIVLLPTERVTFGFHDFDLQNLHTIRPQPMSDNIVMHSLVSDTRSTLRRIGPVVREERLEDYLVFHLIEHNEIDYDDNADLLYKLTGQMVSHIRSYLSTEADVENVVLNHRRQLADFIHAQMLMPDHQWESPTDYEIKVSRGFTLLRPNTFNLQDGEEPRHFRESVRNKADIRRMVFTGFRRCCYPLQKFDSDPERQFSVILEDDSTVIRWMKPASGQFRIEWKNGQPYWPDFVVETTTDKLICEVKEHDELHTSEVQLKADAAIRWCEYASEIACQVGKKPWHYLLLPHDDLASNWTLDGLKASFGMAM